MSLLGLTLLCDWVDVCVCVCLSEWVCLCHSLTHSFIELPFSLTQLLICLRSACLLFGSFGGGGGGGVGGGFILHFTFWQTDTSHIQGCQLSLCMCVPLITTLSLRAWRLMQLPIKRPRERERGWRIPKFCFRKARASHLIERQRGSTLLATSWEPLDHMNLLYTWQDVCPSLTKENERKWRRKAQVTFRLVQNLLFLNRCSLEAFIIVCCYDFPSKISHWLTLICHFFTGPWLVKVVPASVSCFIGLIAWRVCGPDLLTQWHFSNHPLTKSHLTVAVVLMTNRDRKDTHSIQFLSKLNWLLFFSLFLSHSLYVDYAFTFFTSMLNTDTGH